MVYLLIIVGTCGLWIQVHGLSMDTARAGFTVCEKGVTFLYCAHSVVCVIV